MALHFCHYITNLERPQRHSLYGILAGQPNYAPWTFPATWDVKCGLADTSDPLNNHKLTSYFKASGLSSMLRSMLSKSAAFHFEAGLLAPQGRVACPSALLHRKRGCQHF